MRSTNSESIKVQFYGVRGSIPSPPDNNEIKAKTFNLIKEASSKNLTDDESIREFLKNQPLYQNGVVGGNTSCIYLLVNGLHIILDAGSGIRKLGEKLMKQEFGDGQDEAHLFLSHTHWDHIQGFPFFMPAYISGNSISIYGAHNGLEQRISNQQEDEYYPVPLAAMGANIDFVQLRKGDTITVNGIRITNLMLNHPGGSFGYRLDYKGKSLVYATDSEYKNIRDIQYEKYTQFFQNADVLIFDAQFTLAESIEKENWGHSTSIQGVNFAKQANVKHLVLFHHDPSYSDEKLFGILNDAIDYMKSGTDNQNIKISLATEGLELIL
ncbi:MAG: MBL fold metallo-hydrolase [Candidatus Marinimicrobia bacterium]|nr:MBL fold metallo-hydrolase [Candidatus Neomarinimicrobiota bacterium]